MLSKNTQKCRILWMQGYTLLLYILCLCLPMYGLAQPSNASVLQTRLMNLEGAVSDDFRFQVTLNNPRNVAQIYALDIELPEGWRVQYMAMGSRVTAVQVGEKGKQEISVQVIPNPSAKPGKYTLPLKVEASGEFYSIDLEVEITGTYALALSTPDGRISNEVVSGSDRVSTLLVQNTGSLPLKDLELSAQMPSNWEASFEPKNIESLAPGQNKEVQLRIQVPDKTIAGDYMAELSVKSLQQQAKLSYRVNVVTSLLSGWLGIGIILLAIALVFFLIRKYGRR